MRRREEQDPRPDADHFKPSLDLRNARYIWLGTKKKFDAFTFYFEENAHGMFQVHAYRFDADTSTFIVECDEASWCAAGLDQTSDEESIAYLEKLFGKHLGGEKLLANKSPWVSSRRSRTSAGAIAASRPAYDVVLLGDAAHTAHFSIGSGTKLAMEDSIALVKALVAHPDDLAQALELRGGAPADRRAHAEGGARQPALVREREAVPHLDPTQFAFSLLTRSKRITYDNLKLRDAAFAEHVRSWHEARVPRQTGRAGDVHAVHAAGAGAAEPRRRLADVHVFGGRRPAETTSTSPLPRARGAARGS